MNSACSWSCSSSAPDRLEPGLDLLGHPAVHREQLDRVVVLLLEAPVSLEPAVQARLLGRDLRGLLLVVPEAGLGHAALELGDACG